MSLLTLLRARQQAASATQRMNFDFVNAVFEGNIGALNFTRPSIAVATDNNGHLTEVTADNPRFDNDVDGNPLGLLLEPSATNLITYSDFENMDITTPAGIGAWEPDPGTPSTTYTQVTWDRVGPYKAITLNHTDPNERSWLNYRPTLPPGTYTVSVYVDLARTNLSAPNEGENPIVLEMAGPNINNQAARLNDVDPNTGRVTVTTTATGTGDALIRFCVAREFDTTGTITFAAPQLEVNGYASSFIPTQNLEATRAADSLAINLDALTSINNGVTVRTRNAMLRTSGGILNITNAGNTIAADTDGLNVTFETQFGTQTVGPYNATQSVAISLDGTNATLANNGTTQVVPYPVAPGGTLIIGDDYTIGNIRPQHVKDFTIWTPNLSEAETGALTT